MSPRTPTIHDDLERTAAPGMCIPTVGVHIGAGRGKRPSHSLLDVASEKQACKVAHVLLKDFALTCIAEEVTRQNLSPSIRKKVEAKAALEIRKQTENFSIHWVQSSARGLAKVTDLEAYVKRRLAAVGDFKDIRRKVENVVVCSLLSVTQIANR
jgi:hypothetical protein